jgi:predicted aconitase
MEVSREKLTSEGDPDLACIGCPHCSLEEMKDLARMVKGRSVGRGKALWILTSRGVYKRSKEKGYTSIIEKAGGKIFVDTCMVVCPLEKAGYKHMVSNSCKATHYVPSTSRMKASVTELCNALEIVLETGQ